MITTITTNALLIPDLPQNCGLVNTFTGQLASPEQSHDMLNFREIGERASQLYIKHHLLGQPSGSTTILNHVKSIT